jgi:glycosyltransferase involved in cell wall biosynthesis
MEKKFDISVIIPTFNRSSMLASAVESVLGQLSCGVEYELLVVDNNSTDDTPEVVEKFIKAGASVRYQFEAKQGVSNARNCGIANTTSDIIAFLDDDVVAQTDWIRRIKECFDLHPEVLLVGGKVLPRWKSSPPSWLTREHWSPLALVDYGEEPFFVDWNRQFCLVTANLGIRRRAFERYGTFLPHLGRCEDHEFESRLFSGGDKGLYDPQMVAIAEVQKERLRKSYHRAWWSGRGSTLAQFRAYENAPLSGVPDPSERNDVKILGVTLEVYKELFRNLLGWVFAFLRRQESKALHFEFHVRDGFNYICRTYRMLSLRGRGDSSYAVNDSNGDTRSYLSKRNVKRANSDS